MLGIVAVGIAYSNTYFAMLFVVGFYGIAEGIVMGSSQAYAMDLAPEDRRGEFLGVWAIFQNSGALLAPLLIGAIYAIWGPKEAFTLVGAWLLISALLMAAFGPETGGKNKKDYGE